MRKLRNIRHCCSLLLFIAMVFLSCTPKSNDTLITELDGNRLEVSLKALTDSTNTLQLTVNGLLHSEWPLNYPVYRFDYGDVTGDGIPEIAVGVIKPTRFDPKPDKRLFLFRITGQYDIRPLWLGSRVAQPLADFRISSERDSVYIRTMEREQSGKYLVARYYWKGFGIAFHDYIEREINVNRAQQLLINQ